MVTSTNNDNDNAEEPAPSSLRSKRAEKERPDEGGEEVIFEVPPSASVLVVRAFLWLACVIAIGSLLPDVLAYLSPNGRPAMVQIGGANIAPATAVGLAVALMGLLHVAWLAVRRANTWYVLTDEYFMVERGILGKRGWAIPIDDIAEVKYERGIFGILGRFGTINLKIRNHDKIVRLEGVPQVADTTRAILAARARYRRAHERVKKQPGKSLRTPV